MGFRIDLTGKRLGRWTVLNFAGPNKRGQARWKCRCDCGTIRICNRGDLRNGASKSCGCYAVDRIKECKTTHGHSRNGIHTKEYRAWCLMRTRCDKNRASPADFKLYAGNGVAVCKRWLKFENFFKDMGYAPSAKHSVDRYPNKHGNYKPSNCRWATDKQQMRNTSVNRLATWNGKTQCIAAWAEELGMLQATLSYRIKSWPIEKAFTKPIQQQLGRNC